MVSFGHHYDDVRGADAINWCDTHLMEIRPKFAEKDFSCAEPEFIALQAVCCRPLRQRDRLLRHVFQRDVRRIRIDLVRLSTSPFMGSDVAKRANCPGCGDLA